jgi:hypothetical protein
MSKELLEQLAKLIYMQWIHTNGFVPWVDGGNSFKQDEARKIAKEFIESYQAAAPIDNVAVPVAAIRWIKHLEGKASEFHEYGASEGKRLPVGTKFFTATPQVEEMLENAAKIADEYSGEGINPACAEVAQRIRALIPTQANRTEG